MVPKFEFYFSENKDKIFYRFTNVVQGFNLPILLKLNNRVIRFNPTENWKSTDLNVGDVELLSPLSIEKMYYVKAVLVNPSLGN
jgi:hypothetical protein